MADPIFDRGAYDAVLFDAYGTLLDFESAFAAERAALGASAQSLSDLWRRKQLEYSWIRALSRRHRDFWRVTLDALDYALEAHGLAGDAALRDRLADAYRRLDAHEDARATLERMRAIGAKTAILSNGAPAMLEPAVAGAGLAPHLDAVISIEEIGVFKPAPETYAHGCARLDAAPERTLFVSANGWDIAGAGAFGLDAVWINRAGAPLERLSLAPKAVVATLGAMLSDAERHDAR